MHCPQRLGLNGKVSNLAQMLPQARYEHIIINDSDILVPRDYLLRVMAPLAQPEVGMVTTLYRGLAGKTLGSRLEALGLSTDFSAGVLVARAHGRRHSFRTGGNHRDHQDGACARSVAWSRWSITSATITNSVRVLLPRDIKSSWPTSLSRRLSRITAFAISGCINCAGHETSKTAGRHNILD